MFHLIRRQKSIRENTFKIISDAVNNCARCSLHKNRAQTVFGSGNLEPEIVLYGEGPGRDEDEQGLPFVGRAGKLLNELIEQAGMKREDMFVMNSVKCRPPNNRKPELHEINACKQWSEIQIEILKPKIIIALGSTAIEALCGAGLGITKRRGQWENYYIKTNSNIMTIPVLPTFHPAYLLRNPSAKDLFVEDLLIAKNRLNTGNFNKYFDDKLGEECFAVI